MKIERSVEHQGKFDVFLKGNYIEDASMTLEELCQFRMLLDSFLASYVFGTLQRLSEGKPGERE